LTALPDPIDIARAAERIRPHVHRTPLLRTDHFGCGRLLLKAENLQRGGSFKIRGALNAVLRAREEGRIGSAGVITYSSGNHGQAVALAARIVGCASTIVVPEDIARVKLRAIEDLGAAVVLRGTTSEDRLAGAEEIARKTGAHIIPPYEHPDVIAGQGTVGLEILEEAPETDLVVVPVGGGGLISGIAIGIKSRSPRTHVVGVEPAGADDTARSLREGKRVRIDPPRTIADGLRALTPGELTFEAIRRHVDDVWVVADESTSAAQRRLLSGAKLLVEPSGAVGLAAVLDRQTELEEKQVVVILSGGNTDTLPGLAGP